jgi:hypothetical protein
MVLCRAITALAVPPQQAKYISQLGRYFVSVPFLRKWGWLVRDCPEIFEGTNYWRGMRGERQLVL